MTTSSHIPFLPYHNPKIHFCWCNLVVIELRFSRLGNRNSSLVIDPYDSCKGGQSSSHDIWPQTIGEGLNSLSKWDWFHHHFLLKEHIHYFIAISKVILNALSGCFHKSFSRMNLCQIVNALSRLYSNIWQLNNHINPIAYIAHFIQHKIRRLCPDQVPI